MNVTSPSAILANIQTMSAALTGSEVNELPSLEYLRKFRVFGQILNDMLDACRLGKADNWHQIVTDGTTQRQITFQNLVIGLMADDGFESLFPHRAYS